MLPYPGLDRHSPVFFWTRDRGTGILHSQISNANGEGANTTEKTLDEQRKNNQGITTSLAGKIGVYYLKDADVTGLKNAFYKVALTNGSPVVVLNPAKSSSIYKVFGCDLNLTKAQSGGTVTFAGVLDANGDAIDDARFSSDWR